MPIVNTLYFFPFAWIQHLVRAIITYSIITTISKQKYNKIISFISIVGTGMVFSYLSLYIISKIELKPIHEVISIVLYYSIMLILCVFLSENKFYIKVLSVVFSLFAYIFSASITSIIVRFLGSSTTAAYAFEMPLDFYLGECISIFSASFIPITIANYVVSKNKHGFSLRNLLFYIFPITHLLNFISQASIVLYSEQNNLKANDISAIFCVVNTICFVIDFAILIVSERINKIEADNIQLNEQNKINELEYQRILLTNKENEGFKKIRHDYLNLLSTAAGYIEIGKYEKALDIINNTSNNVYNPTSVRLCSNDIINTVFSFKITSASKSGIVINAVVNEHSLVKINDYNLCRILCNLIDNSINATKEANANHIDITLNINENSLEIITKNKYSQKKKQPSKNHGYGTKIIKDILKAQGGTYSQTKNGNEFVTSTIIENK